MLFRLCETMRQDLPHGGPPRSHPDHFRALVKDRTSPGQAACMIRTSTTPGPRLRLDRENSRTRAGGLHDQDEQGPAGWDADGAARALRKAAGGTARGGAQGAHSERAASSSACSCST